MEQWLHCGGVSSSRRLCRGRNWWQSSFLGILSRCSRAWGPWLLCSMGRDRGGFGRTYGPGYLSFCRAGRGGRLCDGTQVMATQGFWSPQWDQWCLSLCGTYCISIWLSNAAPSPPCGWGVLSGDSTPCCNTLRGLSRMLYMRLFWGTGMTLKRCASG